MNALLQAIFGLLCVEVVVIVILAIPWPASCRRALVQGVSNSSALAMFALPMKYFFALVVLTWASTTYTMVQLQAEYPAMKERELAHKLQHETRMFRSQRDFYLAGFAALLLLVISRLYTVFKEVNSLAATKEALKRQADQAVAAFKNLQAENEELKGKGGGKGAGKAEGKGGAEAVAAAGKAGAEGVSAGEGEEAAVLRSKLEKLEKAVLEATVERDEAKRSVEALKKQAEGVAAEYERLTKEKESLANKLSDFELVMGDAVKKSK